MTERMSRTEITERMTLPILNLCLATVSRAEGDLSKCKDMLIDEVCKLVYEAECNAR